MNRDDHVHNTTPRRILSCNVWDRRIGKCTDAQSSHKLYKGVTKKGAIAGMGAFGIFALQRGRGSDPCQDFDFVPRGHKPKVTPISEQFSQQSYSLPPVKKNTLYEKWSVSPLQVQIYCGNEHTDSFHLAFS